MCILVFASSLVACGEAPVEPDFTLQAAPIGPSPGGVADLRITGSTSGTLSLTWTQVDDGTGQPASYRVKHASPPIEWRTATIGCDKTITGTSIGAPLSCTITGLQAGAEYDVRLMSFRVVDGAWQGALYSNITTGSTQASAPAPTQVTDLAVIAATATRITVSWTQVDDGTGSPAWYRVKYAAPPIQWKTATIGCQRTIRGTQIGAPISCTIDGLAPATSYEIRLMSYRVVDGVWVDAHDSNVASGTTIHRIVSTSERIALPPLAGYTYSKPNGVNSSGQVIGQVGRWVPELSRYETLSVLWENGVPVPLPTPPDKPRAVPEDINDAGQIVGSVAGIEDNRAHATLWDDGQIIYLDSLTGQPDFFTRHIDNAGWMGGTTLTESYLWREGQAMQLFHPPNIGHLRSFPGGSSASAGLIVGESMGSMGSAFTVWNRDGWVVWSEASYPRPFTDDRQHWIGMSEAGDAYIKGLHVGLWRWRDGELAPWPNPNDPQAANAMAVSPGGLVLGGLMADSAYTALGVWRNEEFYAFDDQEMWCIDISDVWVLCGQGDGERPELFGEPFIARMEFGGTP